MSHAHIVSQIQKYYHPNVQIDSLVSRIEFFGHTLFFMVHLAVARSAAARGDPAPPANSPRYALHVASTLFLDQFNSYIHDPEISARQVLADVIKSKTCAEFVQEALARALAAAEKRQVFEAVKSLISAPEEELRADPDKALALLLLLVC